VEQGVATLRLNRPETLNSFNTQMHREVREALTRVRKDAAVRCLLRAALSALSASSCSPVALAVSLASCIASIRPNGERPTRAAFVAVATARWHDFPPDFVWVEDGLYTRT
jgi:hypothetical protein